MNNNNSSRASAAGYSRSEWGALSIQERIRAMNETLDTVEQKEKQQQHQKGDNNNDSNDNINNITVAAPNSNDETPKKRSSVVDIWRKREGSNTTGISKPKAQTSITAVTNTTIPKRIHSTSMMKNNNNDNNNKHNNSSNNNALHDIKANLTNKFANNNNNLWKKDNNNIITQDNEEEKKENDEMIDDNDNNHIPPADIPPAVSLRRSESASPLPPPLPGSIRKSTIRKLESNININNEPADLTIMPASSNHSISNESLATANSSKRSDRVVSMWEEMSKKTINSLSDREDDSASSFALLPPTAETTTATTTTKRTSVVDIWKKRALTPVQQRMESSTSPPTTTTMKSAGAAIADMSPARLKKSNGINKWQKPKVGNNNNNNNLMNELLPSSSNRPNENPPWAKALKSRNSTRTTTTTTDTSEHSSGSTMSGKASPLLQENEDTEEVPKNPWANSLRSRRINNISMKTDIDGRLSPYQNNMAGEIKPKQQVSNQALDTEVIKDVSENSSKSSTVTNRWKPVVVRQESTTGTNNTAENVINNESSERSDSRPSVLNRWNVQRQGSSIKEKDSVQDHGRPKVMKRWSKPIQDEKHEIETEKGMDESSPRLERPPSRASMANSMNSPKQDSSKSLNDKDNVSTTDSVDEMPLKTKQEEKIESSDQDKNDKASVENKQEEKAPDNATKERVDKVIRRPSVLDRWNPQPSKKTFVDVSSVDNNNFRTAATTGKRWKRSNNNEAPAEFVERNVQQEKEQKEITENLEESSDSHPSVTNRWKVQREGSLRKVNKIILEDQVPNVTKRRSTPKQTENGSLMKTNSFQTTPKSQQSLAASPSSLREESEKMDQRSSCQNENNGSSSSLSAFDEKCTADTDFVAPASIVIDKEEPVSKECSDDNVEKEDFSQKDDTECLNSVNPWVKLRSRSSNNRASEPPVLEPSDSIKSETTTSGRKSFPQYAKYIVGSSQQEDLHETVSETVGDGSFSDSNMKSSSIAASDNEHDLNEDSKVDEDHRNSTESEENLIEIEPTTNNEDHQSFPCISEEKKQTSPRKLSIAERWKNSIQSKTTTPIASDDKKGPTSLRSESDNTIDQKQDAVDECSGENLTSNERSDSMQQAGNDQIVSLPDVRSPSPRQSTSSSHVLSLSVNNNVSALVKEHSQRTPVGQARSKMFIKRQQSDNELTQSESKNEEQIDSSVQVQDDIQEPPPSVGASALETSEQNTEKSLTSSKAEKESVIDESVSQLIKEHVVRTPVGKIKSLWENNVSLEGPPNSSIEQASILSEDRPFSPTKDIAEAELSVASAHHQQDDSQDLSPSSETGDQNTQHLLTLKEQKELVIDDSVSSLIKEHSVRTPVGKIKNMSLPERNVSSEERPSALEQRSTPSRIPHSDPIKGKATACSQLLDDEKEAPPSQQDKEIPVDDSKSLSVHENKIHSPVGKMKSGSLSERKVFLENPTSTLEQASTPSRHATSDPVKRGAKAYWPRASILSAGNTDLEKRAKEREEQSFKHNSAFDSKPKRLDVYLARTCSKPQSGESTVQADLSSSIPKTQTDREDKLENKVGDCPSGKAKENTKDLLLKSGKNTETNNVSGDHTKVEKAELLQSQDPEGVTEKEKPSSDMKSPRKDSFGNRDFSKTGAIANRWKKRVASANIIPSPSTKHASDVSHKEILGLSQQAPARTDMSTGKKKAEPQSNAYSTGLKSSQLDFLLKIKNVPDSPSFIPIRESFDSTPSPVPKNTSSDENKEMISPLQIIQTWSEKLTPQRNKAPTSSQKSSDTILKTGSNNKSEALKRSDPPEEPIAQKADLHGTNSFVTTKLPKPVKPKKEISRHSSFTNPSDTSGDSSAFAPWENSRRLEDTHEPSRESNNSRKNFMMLGRKHTNVRSNGIVSSSFRENSQNSMSKETLDTTDETENGLKAVKSIDSLKNEAFVENKFSGKPGPKVESRDTATKKTVTPPRLMMLGRRHLANRSSQKGEGVAPTTTNILNDDVGRDEQEVDSTEDQSSQDASISGTSTEKKTNHQYKEVLPSSDHQRSNRKESPASPSNKLAFDRKRLMTHRRKARLGKPQPDNKKESTASTNSPTKKIQLSPVAKTPLTPNFHASLAISPVNNLDDPHHTDGGNESTSSNNKESKKNLPNSMAKTSLSPSFQAALAISPVNNLEEMLGEFDDLVESSKAIPARDPSPCCTDKAEPVFEDIRATMSSTSASARMNNTEKNRRHNDWKCETKEQSNYRRQNNERFESLEHSYSDSFVDAGRKESRENNLGQFQVESGNFQKPLSDNRQRLSTRYNTSSRFMEPDGSVPARIATGGTASTTSMNLDSSATDSFPRHDVSDDLISHDQLARTRRQKTSKMEIPDDKSTSKSVNSGWDSSSVKEMTDWAAEVGIPFDFKQIASAVDEQVSAFKDLVGGGGKSQDKKKRPLKLPCKNLAPCDVEDVAIEVEYVEDSFSEEDGDDEGCFGRNVDETCREGNTFQSDEMECSPSCNRIEKRRAYV